MLSFLLACLPSNILGGGGGGPFTMTRAQLTQRLPSSGSVKCNASLSYRGSISGITLLLEQNFDHGGWVTVGSGLLPTDFPQVVDTGEFYNKFGIWRDFVVRITDEADPTATVTSNTFSSTYLD